MRRLLFSLLALSFVGAVVGCRATHGVCDCCCDCDDPCAYRAPWVNEVAPHADGAPSVVPTPMPDIKDNKDAQPKEPKKL